MCLARMWEGLRVQSTVTGGYVGWASRKLQSAIARDRHLGGAHSLKAST